MMRHARDLHPIELAGLVQELQDLLYLDIDERGPGAQWYNRDKFFDEYNWKLLHQLMARYGLRPGPAPKRRGPTGKRWRTGED